MRRALAPVLLLLACAEPASRAPSLALFAPALRPDDPASNDLFRFAPGDQVESFDSSGGGIRVHFTRAGQHKVPPLDADADGTPDYVEEVAAIYDEVLAFYTGPLALKAPLADGMLGGNGRFDVYLVDFARAADGAFRVDGCRSENASQCFGYIVQENDFAGYGYKSTTAAVRILASHEFFHAIQAAYDSGQGSVFSEGTAVWATERFDPSLTDFEGFLRGYLQAPDRSLDLEPTGPVDPFTYGSAIFFRFLEERFGVELVPALLAASEDGAGGVADPYWLDALDAMLQAKGSDFAEAFAEFGEWNLLTGAFAQNGRGFAEAASYPQVKVEQGQAPLFVERGRYFHASTQYFGVAPGARTAMTAALVPHPGDGVALEGMRLTLGVQRQNTFGPLQRIQELSAGTETVETDGAFRLVVIVSNTLRQGTSRRPSLCVGTVEEVAACQAVILDQADAGTPEPPVDAGMEPQTPAAPEEEVGCGCSGGGSHAALMSTLLVLGLLPFRMGGRRVR